MFKRTQQEVSDSSKHWYQDKYQQVLTQRNILALLAIISLVIAAMAVFAVMSLAPLKTVEPYLITMDEKTGITARVRPVTRDKYSADEAVDRYFTALYLRARESYNAATIRQNYEIVRLMSARDVFRPYIDTVSLNNENSITTRLDSGGLRDIKIRSMAYLTDATGDRNNKTIQAHVVVTETGGKNPDPKPKYLVITVTFTYAILDLSEDERWMNPIGYSVIRYQTQTEVE